MSIRREQVILDLDDRLTPGLARAAVAAGLLKGALNDLGGSATKTGRDLEKPAKSSEKMSQSMKRDGPDIDKYSGRLRTLADVAVTLGPALIPLSAGAIPALTGALAGLGAAAGGIGVTVLAMHGLGDAIKSIDAYRLDPTVENLQKMRIEQEKLGPAAADFARYIANLEPTLRGLQQVAGENLFPGFEDGIDSLLTRGPQVQRIIAELATGMGDIARDAGRGLSSAEWTPFFDYIETDAKPTLEEFAHAAGNVALGFANILVAFAPLSSGFTSGLLDASEAFKEWSQGLDENQSFQDFVDYIRESGPQVLDFLGALVGALAGITKAAAPWGTFVLQALTGVADVFGVIADTPIGPGLYTAAAAMIAFSRASSIAEKSSARFSATWDKMSRLQTTAGAVGGLALLASSLTDVDDKAGMANTTLGASAGLMAGGPWGLAIGAAIGQVLDFKDAYDQANSAISSADDALRSTDTNALLKERADLVAQLTKEHPDDGTLGNYMDAVVGSFHDFTGQSADFKERIAEIDGALNQGGDVADLFGEAIGQTGDEFRAAASGADQFEGALARLNGWFDKRDAIRSYKDSIDALKGSLKDGFTRDDAANVDAIGRSILQVAQNIKNPQARNSFLEQARGQLVDMAQHSAPRAAAAIQQVIDKFDNKGLTHPIIKPEVDDSRAVPAAEKIKNKVKGQFDIMDALAAEPTVKPDDTQVQAVTHRTTTSFSRIDQLRAIPKVSVDAGNSLSLLDHLAALLNSLHDRTITVRTNHVGGVTSSAGGHSAPLDPRIQASRTSSNPLDKMSVVLGRGLVSGGSDQDSVNTAKASLFGDSLLRGGQAANDAAQSLKGLKKQLDATQKAYDKAKSARDDAVSRRDSLSSTIQQNLMGGSIWDASSGSVWAAGAHPANSPSSAIAALNERKDRAQRFVAALNILKSKGVTGGALQEILSEGLEATEAMAAADLGTLSQFASAFNDANSALAAAGLAGGNAVEGANIAATTKRLDRLHDDLQEIKQAVNQADNNNKSAHQQSTAQFTLAVNGGASNGHRRGK